MAHELDAPEDPLLTEILSDGDLLGRSPFLPADMWERSDAQWLLRAKRADDRDACCTTFSKNNNSRDSPSGGAGIRSIDYCRDCGCECDSSSHDMATSEESTKGACTCQSASVSLTQLHVPSGRLDRSTVRPIEPTDEHPTEDWSVGNKECRHVDATATIAAIRLRADQRPRKDSATAAAHSMPLPQGTSRSVVESGLERAPKHDTNASTADNRISRGSPHAAVWNHVRAREPFSSLLELSALLESTSSLLLPPPPAGAGLPALASSAASEALTSVKCKSTGPSCVWGIATTQSETCANLRSDHARLLSVASVDTRSQDALCFKGSICAESCPSHASDSPCHSALNRSDDRVHLAGDRTQSSDACAAGAGAQVAAGCADASVCRVMSTDLGQAASRADIANEAFGGHSAINSISGDLTANLDAHPALHDSTKKANVGRVWQEIHWVIPTALPAPRASNQDATPAKVVADPITLPPSRIPQPGAALHPAVPHHAALATGSPRPSLEALADTVLETSVSTALEALEVISQCGDMVPHDGDAANAPSDTALPGQALGDLGDLERLGHAGEPVPGSDAVKHAPNAPNLPFYNFFLDSQKSAPSNPDSPSADILSTQEPLAYFAAPPLKCLSECAPPPERATLQHSLKRASKAAHRIKLRESELSRRSGWRSDVHKSHAKSVLVSRKFGNSEPWAAGLDTVDEVPEKVPKTWKKRVRTWCKKLLNRHMNGSRPAK